MGIKVVPKPVIEIALINKRYEEVLLNEEFLDTFYSKREQIMKYYYDENLTYPPLTTNGIVLEFGRVGIKKAVSFKGQDKTIIILRDTCLNLLHLYDSIKNVRRCLATHLENVSIKYDQFLTIVRDRPSICSWSEIKSSPNYDSSNIIDTELMELCYYEILNYVKNEASTVQ